MSSFRDLVKKVNNQSKTVSASGQEQPNEKDKEKSSSFRDLVSKVNNGTIKVGSSLTDTQVDDWFRGIGQVSKSAYEYLSAEGYKTPNSSLQKDVSGYIYKANEVGQYLRANKSSLSNYDELWHNYTDTVNYLYDLKNGLESSKDFYATFENEEDYDFWKDHSTLENRQQWQTEQNSRLEKLKAEKEAENARWREVDPIEMGAESIEYQTAVQEHTKKLKAIDEEIASIETELTNYERGNYNKNGRYYGTKVLDDYYSEFALRDDFSEVSANRDFGNATKLDYDKYYYQTYGGTMYDERGNAVETSLPGYSEVDIDSLAINDPLGFYLDAMNTIGGGNIRYEANWIAPKEYEQLIVDGSRGSWSELTDTEVGIYYVILKEQGYDAAMKYLSDMETELNRRETMATNKRNAESYNEGSFAWKVAMNAASVPSAFFGSALGFLDNAANILKGEEINPYSPAQSGMHYKQTVRGATAEELDETGIKVPVVNFTLGDIYQTGMSRLDSALATSVFGGGGTVFLGMGAANDEAYKLYQQGASAEQITLGALAAGTAEAVWEYISYGKLKEIEQLGSPGDWVKSVLVQGFNEASEEALTEVSNIISNALVMGSRSDLAELYNENEESAFYTFVDIVKQTLHSAFGGFLSGGVAGGLQTIGDLVNVIAANAEQNEQFRNAGRTIIGVGGVEDLQTLANEVAGVSDGKMQKSLTKQARKVSGETASGNNFVGNVVAKAKNSSNATKVGKLYYTTKVASAVQNNADISNRVRGFEYAIDIGKLVKEQTEKAFTPEGKYKVSDTGEATVLETEVDVEGKTITKDTGEVIDIKGVASIHIDPDTEKVVMLLDIGDGKTINAENVAYANKNDALIYEAIASLGDKINSDTANKLIGKYKGGDALFFARGMAQAYTYGFYGIDKSELTGKNTLASELTEEQMNFAYGLGEQYRPVKDIENKVNAREELAKNIESGKTHAPGEKGVYYRDRNGNAVSIDTYLKNSNVVLKNDVQKTGIEAMRRLAETLGVRINVFESWVENGKTYYLNEYGKKIEGNPNGFYDTLNGEIYIALDAGSDFSGTMLFTIAHELTHQMRQWSPEHFTKIAKIVFSQAGFKGNVSEMIALKQKKAEKKGKPISYDTAMEEVVADAMETILKDGKAFEFMQELKQQDRASWQKVKAWFKNLAKFLRKMLAAYSGKTANTREGQIVSAFAKDLLRQIEQIWAEGAVAAGENYQMAIGNVKVSNQITMEEDVIDSSNTGISKETKTGAKMQERTEFEAQPKQVFSVSTTNGKADSSMLGTNKSVKELRDARFKENGFTKEDVDKINGFIKDMADNMAKYRLKYKFVGLQNIHDAKIILNPMTGKIVLSAMVNNSDYSVNFDFTKICKKRVALQEVLETLAREKGKVTDGKVTEVNLSPANIKRINDILASYGVETACLCCFVESKRYNIQNYYQEKVVDVWNQLVNEVAPDADYFNFADSDVDTSKIPDSEFAELEMQMKEWAGKTGKSKDVEQKMREFLTDSPAARKKLRFSDLVTANGRTNLHKLYPEIESLILSKLGQSAPKSVEAFTPYNGEIDLLEAKGDGDIVKYLYSIAGVRSQSFSDFMIAHVFDVLQKTASMSARKMPAHVYTKEIARAMLFGMTGEKHNMSVLHNVDPDVDSWSAGLSKDGEYNFSDYEAYKKGYSEFVQSIGWKDAVALQNTEGYSKDCGIIGVGFSYNHMLKLHNDPEVRQVIGYHTSQMPVEVKPLTHLDKAADYTGVQNTKAFAGFAKPNYAIPEGVPSYATPPQDITPKGNKKNAPKTTAVSDTFDIVDTFNKLSKGKTGDARTAAAKETLRQLLEYANDHGYVIKTATGEKGKGEFDLYGDVQKTENPYLTTDHYIEYCIERGLLPMFYEFSMNPNYYKDIFDFNVFDRKSYNPETGLHEDSDGRKAYAPQTAVHMLNEDGSLAFPENFFDIVDKQMNSYNSYMQDVDSKMPSIMDEVRTVTNSTTLMSDRYSPESLFAKDPLAVATFPVEEVPTKRKKVNLPEVVKEAKRGTGSIVYAVDKENPKIQSYVYIPDIDSNVLVNTRGIVHGLQGKITNSSTMSTAEVEQVLPDVLRNSIAVNELSPREEDRAKGIVKSYILFGYAKRADGQEYLVRSTINHFEGNKSMAESIAIYDVLKGTKAKKMDSEVIGSHTGNPAASHLNTTKPNYTISVNDLLDIVKENYPELLSDNFREYYGVTVPKADSLLFSDRESLTPDQQKHFDYNQKQKAVGSALKTLKGSSIKRSTKFGVGKEIGGEIYFHKDYAEDILPDEVLAQAQQLLEEEQPGFEYNCLKYNPKTGVVAFQEAPDFDTAREPVVGDYVSANTNTGVVKTGHSNYIWHHKWNWVKNDYSGFDVAESWNWSKQWLSTLTEVSDGNGIERWNAQLDKFGLPHDGALFSEREQEYDSKDTSIKNLASTFTKFGLKSTDRVLDWGGGQYDIAKKAVEHGYPGIKFEVVDAFNRTKSHNDRILKEYAENPATVLTINNVLNVIKETDIIEDVIRESKEYLAEGCLCYINIYEGNKTGTGKETPKGWQNNQPAEWYKQFAEKYYKYVERFGDILVACDNPIDRKSVPKAEKETAQVMRDKSDEIKKSEPSMRESLYSDRILMGSLFSGGGTLEAGLAYQMLDKQFGVEYDGKIASVYADNHGDHIQVGRVEDFDISKFNDIFYLHASPVCHNFSNAKHGAKELQQDIDSAKATAKHLETAMPQVFTVENAPGYRKSESLKIITDKLTELGYKWDVDVYNSADYGSATSRNRVILRAVKDGELPAKPAKQERTNSWDKVTRDLWDTLPKSYLRPSFISAIENTRNLPILDADGKVNVNKPLLILTTNSGHAVTYCWEGDICPTLTTKCGEARLVMPDGNIYAVTPEFMGRIQGLPNDYKYPSEKTRAFTIIGNGIPTHLTKAVVGGVLDSAYEQTHEGKVLYQDRESDSVSNRSLLANAFEGLAQTDAEKNKIQEYKSKIAIINEEEKKLRELNAQIKELSFAEGPRDTKKINALRFDATQAANRINTYDKQLLRLEASKPLQDVLAREKKRAYKKAEMEGKKALAKQKEKSAKTQRELIDRWKETRKRAVENRDKTAMRHKIQNVVGELNQLLLTDDKKRHVPMNLKKAVADALALVNMDTVGAEERIAKYEALIAKETDPDKIDAYTVTLENIKKQGEKMGQRLKELRDAYEEISESDDPDIANAYDPVIASSLKELASSIGNTSLRNMTLEQLSDVYDMYKMVLTRVRDANKAFLHARNESIGNLASRVVGEVRKVRGERKDRVARLDSARSFSWNNLKPVYAMERIGSDTLAEAFKNVRAGEDTWVNDVVEAREYYLDKAKKHGYDSWDFDKKYTFESTSGLEFELTLEQIMSLYAYSKREQSLDHLRLGGFVFDSNIETYKEKDGKTGKSILKYKVNTAEAHQISAEILANITGKLTKDQMAFVDDMQEYLSTVMGAKGNEVTMSMYGVKLFKEKFYFPLKSAKQFMFEQNEVSGEVRIKNSGFTNKVVAKANNPVILNGFMDVWSDHINDMSMYHAFVLPLEDFNRIFNYKSPKKEGQPSVSVKGTIQGAYTPAAVDYVKQLITDLNGGARSDPRENIGKQLAAMFKKAKVFNSLSVFVQQFSAIGRAYALVDPKYFRPTSDGKNHAQQWEELKHYAPVAAIKEMGYFDTDMGRSTREFIKANEYSTFKDQVKGFFTDGSYRDEVMSKLPAWADEVTWCAIWNAVKRETLSTHKDLRPGSEEFLKAAGERFTEVITKTQVYDSVLARSANMRSKSGLMSMVTSFMAEPTTTINMLEDAIIKAKRGDKKYAKRAFASVAVSILLNNALASIVYAMRDDDEDETLLEKYAQALASGLLDDINPITYYPYLKDVWSLFQGYDIERADMSLISDFADASQGLIKAYTADDGDVVGAWHDFAGTLLNIGGVPLDNIRREMKGGINFVKNFIADVTGRATTWNSMADSLQATAQNSIPVWGWFPDESKSDKLYDAFIKGDTAYVDRMKGSYKDEDAYHNAVREALRENDSRIKEAAMAEYNGNPSERVRIARLIIADGFDQDDVVMAINSELNAMEPDEPAGEPKAKGLYTAENFAREIANGDQASANAAKIDIIATEQKNGKSEEEAVKKFNSSAKTELKKLFMAGELTEDEVIDTLITFCDMEEEDAVKHAGSIAYEKEHPELDGVVTYTEYQRWETEGKPHGVTIEMFIEVAGFRDDGTSDSVKSQDEVALYISSVTTNRAERHALWCCFYKASTSPWR